ncbi:MAG: Ig-like domain-containing protein [Chloroflexi bacterium]|nr:Ig-like domain-containing protein [Chloroflexota bacterium]
MSRAISIGSALVALVFLVLVLADATLVDRRPPSVTEVRLSATAGGDRIAEPISSINVVFSEAVRTDTAEPRFHIVPPVEGALSWDGTTLIFTPSEPMPAATAFVVTVDPGYLDLAGNVATTGVDGWAFATAGPPRVLVATPEDGAVGISTDAVVELEFDRLMDTTSVEAAIVFDPGVEFSVTWSGPRVAISFTSGLAIGTLYTLRIRVDAADTAGAHLAVPFQTRFTTVSPGMAGQPVPADGVAGVSVRSPIAVFFPGPIDPSTIDGALSLSPAVPGAIELLETPTGVAASAVLFRPALPLAQGTTYTVTLAPVVRELGAAANVAPGFSWTFTTGAVTESVQNQIVYLSNRSGVPNVWVVNPDGSNERQLTWEPTGVRSFDVTGDGRRVVFESPAGIGTVDVDGESRQILTREGLTETLPRLTPDETAILLSRRDSQIGTDLGWWLVPTPWTFGDARQVLTSGAWDDGEAGWPATFDAGGDHALVVIEDGTALELVDLSGEAPIAQSVATVSRASGRAAWSQTAGGFVVAAIAGGPTSSVYIVDTTGRMTALPGGRRAGPIAVDRDGRLLVVFEGGAVGRHLLLTDAEGREVTDLTVDESLFELGATFAPDGDRAIAVRQLAGRPPELWLIDLVSGEQAQFAAEGRDPIWLP